MLTDKKRPPGKYDVVEKTTPGGLSEALEGEKHCEIRLLWKHPRP